MREMALPWRRAVELVGSEEAALTSSGLCRSVPPGSHIVTLKSALNFPKKIGNSWY
jgi:hypothetical protein